MTINDYVFHGYTGYLGGQRDNTQLKEKDRVHVKEFGCNIALFDRTVYKTKEAIEESKTFLDNFLALFKRFLWVVIKVEIEDQVTHIKEIGYLKVNLSSAKKFLKTTPQENQEIRKRKDRNLSDIAQNHILYPPVFAPTRLVVQDVIAPKPEPQKPPILPVVVEKPKPVVVVAPPKPPIFAQADLITFQAVLRFVQKNGVLLGLDYPMTIHLNENNQKVAYRIWEDREGIINTQPHAEFVQGSQKDKLGLLVNKDGEIVTVYKEGKPLNSEVVPDEFHEKMFAIFKKTLESASTYKNIGPFGSFMGRNINPVLIVLIKRGLHEVPEYHLSELVKIMAKPIKTQGRVLDTTVLYLKDDLSFEQGVDAGGLSRDYMDSLFTGLTKNPKLKNLSFVPKDEFVRPVTKGVALRRDEQKLYEEMGMMMMFCSHHNQIATGIQFEHGLFAAALSLPAQEIDKKFDQLSEETKFLMMHAIFDAENELPKMKKIKIAATNVFLQPQPSDEDFLLAAEWLQADELRDLFTKNGKPDVQAIKTYIEEFKKDLKQALNDNIGSMLAPIHAMAKGMKLFCGRRGYENIIWNDRYYATDAMDFATAVQGSLDRDKIIASIKFETHPDFQYKLARLPANQRKVLDEKIRWLKNWIKNPNTPNKDLMKFLKFVTGTSSLTENGIKVIFEDACSPLPSAHTCAFQLVLSPIMRAKAPHRDDTEANFVECLKTSIEMGGDSFQTA